MQVLNISSKYGTWKEDIDCIYYEAINSLKEIDEISYADKVIAYHWKGRILLTDPRTFIEKIRTLSSIILINEDHLEQIKKEFRPPPQLSKGLFDTIGYYTIVTENIKSYIKRKKGVEVPAGPTIFLIPEKISRLYLDIMEKYELKKDDLEALLLYKNPIEIILKIALFHEIGHCVFDNELELKNYKNDKNRKIISEGMANWFAYCLLNKDGKKVLDIISQKEPEEYKKYKLFEDCNKDRKEKFDSFVRACLECNVSKVEEAFKNLLID